MPTGVVFTGSAITVSAESSEGVFNVVPVSDAIAFEAGFSVFITFVSVVEDEAIPEGDGGGGRGREGEFP